MPDETPTDNRTFMRIPGWIWDKLFWALAVALIGYLTHTNTAAIYETGDKQAAHAEAQLAKQEEVKTEVATGLSNVAAKVQETAQGRPQVVVEQKVIEAKPADAKADAPGLTQPCD